MLATATRALLALTPLLGASLAAQIATHPNGYSISAGATIHATFTVPTIAGQAPTVQIATLPDGWHRVLMTWNLSAPVAQDDLAIEFTPGFTPDQRWIPHLAPLPGAVVGQHMFRSPAILLAAGDCCLAVVPDLELCGSNPATPWYLDYDEPAGRAWLGLSQQMLAAHVFFAKAPGMILGPGRVELGFYARAWRDPSTPVNLWGPVARFLWDRYAEPLLAIGLPHSVPMGEFVELAYGWAFDRWKKPMWVEDLTGTIGAPQVIVDYTQSPYATFPPPPRPIEIWNQAWFSAIRTASGMFRWSAAPNTDLASRAGKIKELTLAAPVNGGVFPSVLRVRGPLQGEGLFDMRLARWTNSDRTPIERRITRDFYNVIDASDTALWMLRWYRELEQDPRLLGRVQKYAQSLVGMQSASGFFPAWLHPVTLAPSGTLDDSPQSARSATLLFELASLTNDATLVTPALSTVDAIIRGPAVTGRWEDFETWWSDNTFGRMTHVGRPFVRNGMHKQNTLSMFWTAEALLHAYEATQDPRYLDWGVRVLDELSMFQQVWQPPFMYVPTVGGFGVMNADGEWNDARQSLFAELFMDYYVATGDRSYFARGVAALKASFTMMYTPLNPATYLQWEAIHPSLEPRDHGFMMENYAHWGSTSPNGDGMGFFAIFSWGAGSASEAFARVRDHYGQVYIDRARGIGFGIDSIDVAPQGSGYRLTDRTGRGMRSVEVTFDSGKRQTVQLNGPTIVH